MSAVLTVLYYVLFVFWLLLIARIVIEVVRSLARDWHPRGVMAIVLETMLSATDPPVRLLRRIIPTIPIGGARLDVSIMVLLFVVFILMVNVGAAVPR
ncbi:MAG: YggT family protein [Actinomycetota bacterium]|nr:YggT family protein [Actinomycetota bacterium]